MPWIFRAILSVAFIASNMALAASDDRIKYYDILYEAQLEAGNEVARVSITLKGAKLPSRLTLHVDPERHKNVTSSGGVKINNDEVIWEPNPGTSTLTYDFVIDEIKASGRYDSRITNKWAIFRSDKLVPPISARAARSLQSRATLAMKLPGEWSVLAPYSKNKRGDFELKDPGRRFIRPKGWMIAGEIGSRQDVIDGTSTVIAAPLGKGVRRQDTLAFLSWTLPDLKKVFPEFPQELLIVMARDPMWRGGLSGTRSLFMHADRPLISGNRTSSILHELIHVGTGIRGDKESDWIVEGIAEYYSLQTLRRSGGISERRFQQALENLAKWGTESPNLLVKSSSGPVTARATVVLHEIDQTIQKSSNGNRSLDDVVTALAAERGEVTLKKFRALVEEAAGNRVPQLDRKFLAGND
ncbi:hypothetical protein [Biformimicrobium ophioploci]|uniref:Peptidase M61 catalytic domain-containing protein n=1 Tax=Biformimicrobium ophioploci TaxID=3036711 RepID=A0ABQ6LY13_9GAMM|nr:hypothetical protein [Microbulbifer sp. NKW57]GMG86959.1 hypothetical protein MNKW57_12800 [Microbulbifer sp. NKW57]